jgi:L-lactate dehydrogenase
VLDLNHGLFFAPPVKIHAGNYDDCRGAGVVVITAGASQKPGQSRLDLVGANVGIVRSVMHEVAVRTRDAVVVVVTNPVDVLTYFAISASDLPEERVMGSGTVLDSARLRYLLGQIYRVDERNIHAYVAGEHGDSEVCLWSTAQIGAMKLDEFCQTCHDRGARLDKDAVQQRVRDSAYHVIESKGATYYAVSLALERIVGAILRNERSVLPVSAMVRGLYGIEDVCLSVPRVVGAEGAGDAMVAGLDDDEVRGLQQSAVALRSVIDEVKRNG